MTIDVELNEQIATTASRFLPARFPIKPTGPFPDREDLRKSWKELVELGWPFVLATEHGSMAGASQVDTIFRNLGRNPIAGPTTDMFVGLPLVWRGIDAAAQSYLEPHLAGERLLACAHASEGPDGVAGTALWDGAEFYDGSVTGAKTLVDGHAIVDDLLVFARKDGLPVLLLVEASTAGVRFQPLVSPDLSHSFALTHFEAASATVLVEGERAVEIGEAFQTLARLAAVAELTGLAEAALAMTVDYAKLRKQFGRAIGSFQAIKHLLAEAKMVEYSLACVSSRLAEELEEGAEADNGAIASRRALAYASRAAQSVMDASLQVHGGIGFTLEYGLSWLYNRATTLWGLWGDPNTLAMEIAARHFDRQPSVPARVPELASA